MEGVTRADPLLVHIRMPADLKARLDEAAVAADRTLTAEIVRRLEESFGAPDPVEDLKREVQDLKQQFVSFSRKRR